jgi:hypothetical protein
MYKESIKINELESKLLSSQISLSGWIDMFYNVDALQGKDVESSLQIKAQICLFSSVYN